MGPQQCKLNSFVRCCRTIGTGNKFSVSLFSACCTIQVDYNEVTFDRAGIKPSQVTLKRFTKFNWVLHNLANFLFNLLLYAGMFSDAFKECLFKFCFHQSPKTSSRVCHLAVPSRSLDCTSTSALWKSGLESMISMLSPCVCRLSARRNCVITSATVVRFS